MLAQRALLTAALHSGKFAAALLLVDLAACVALNLTRDGCSALTSTRSRTRTACAASRSSCARCKTFTISCKIVIGFAFTFGTAYVLFVRQEYEKIHLLRWYKTQKKRDQDEDNQTQKMMHIELHTMEQPNEGPGALISSGGAV